MEHVFLLGFFQSKGGVNLGMRMTKVDLSRVQEPYKPENMEKLLADKKVVERKMSCVKKEKCWRKSLQMSNS